MMSSCARALRICAMLAMPASAIAQSTRSPTVFSPSAQMGSVNVRAAVVLADYTIKPLPLLKVVARRTDRADSVAAQTDLDGRVSMTLPVGTYTLRAKPAQPIAGRSYAWAVRVVVRGSRTELVQLTNANATSDSVKTAVASAPAPALAPTPAPAAVKQPAAAPEKTVVHHPSPAVERAVQQPIERPNPAPVDTTARIAPPPERARAVVASPRPARRIETIAPRANTSKLMLGLSLNGSSVTADDLSSSRESGVGLGAQLGWGFTKNFALVLDGSAARIEGEGGDFNLAHFDVGGRWHFVSASRALVPFLEVGVSGRAASEDDVLMADESGNVYTGDLTILGGGVSFGGGLQYFIAQKWALGGSFKWTMGEFSRIQVNNVTVDGFEIDATSARFNMGFTWFPMGRGR